MGDKLINADLPFLERPSRSHGHSRLQWKPLVPGKPRNNRDGWALASRLLREGLVHELLRDQRRRRKENK